MQTIYTIGYQKLTVDRLIQIMTEKNIDRVIDIRSKPYSRFPEWNTNALKKRLGARYIWKGDILGGLSGPVPEQGIEYLATTNETVVLLCMEHDPARCHRFQDIAPRLEQMGVNVIHIVDGGTP